MEAITHAQVQELVTRLPSSKLLLAYRLLVNLTTNDGDASSLQQDFMLLPLAERRLLMGEQAQQIVTHYEETASDREEWQGGDLVEY